MKNILRFEEFSEISEAKSPEEEIKEIEKKERERYAKMEAEEKKKQRKMMEEGEKESKKRYFNDFMWDKKKSPKPQSRQEFNTTGLLSRVPTNPFSAHDFNKLIRSKALINDEKNPDFYWNYKNGKRVGFRVIKR